jgi:hypothetical protein
VTRHSAGYSAEMLALQVLRWPRRLTSSLRSLPDFIIVGAMKTRATSLYDSLCLHPRILRPLSDRLGEATGEVHCAISCGDLLILFVVCSATLVGRVIIVAAKAPRPPT